MSKKTVEELRNEVISLMEEYDSQLNVLDMARQSCLLKEKMEEFRQGIFQVLFTGTFDAGKSTTLNAVMHQKLLGTSINPETPIITRVVNGMVDRDEVTVSYRDGRADKVMSLETFQREFRLDAKNKEKFKEILYATAVRRLPIDTVVFADSPGLDNTDMDDFIATEYAGKAEAVVFMMNATAALKKSERAYIQRYYERRGLTNVFIVVNWWNMVKPEEENVTKEKIRNDLQLVFEDKDGVFNEELYSKRVFYVDAHTSECYRTGTRKTVLVGRKEIPVDLEEEDDAGSGIPEFETALMDFLRSSDRDRDGYISYMNRMAGMYQESCDSIEERKKAIASSLEDLKEKEKALSDSIEKFNRILNGIESVFDDTINTIMLNAGSSYDDFVRSVENNWDSYFKGIKVDFGMWQGVQIMGQKLKDGFTKTGRWLTGKEEDEADKLARDAKFQKIVQPIADIIEVYIKEEGDKMGINIMAKSEMAIKRMNKSLEEYCKDLEDLNGEGIDLRDLLKDLGKKGKVDIEKITGGSNLAQILISVLLFGNIDDAIKNVLSGGESWGSFIKETIMTELTEIVIAAVVSMLTGTWIIYLIARVFYGILRLNSNAQDLGKKILLDPDHKTRNGMLEGLRDQRASTLANMEGRFNQKIKGSNKNLTNEIKENIRQRQMQLRKLIELRMQKGFNAEREKSQMDEARRNLLLVYNKLSTLLEGRTYSEQEIFDKAVPTISG